MKQYSVEYVGFMTILAESEEEARAKFAKVDHGEDSDYAEIRTIECMCEVYKRMPVSRLRALKLIWRKLKGIQ